MLNALAGHAALPGVAEPHPGQENLQRRVRRPLRADLPALRIVFRRRPDGAVYRSFGQAGRTFESKSELGTG